MKIFWTVAGLLIVAGAVFWLAPRFRSTAAPLLAKETDAAPAKVGAQDVVQTSPDAAAKSVQRKSESNAAQPIRPEEARTTQVTAPQENQPEVVAAKQEPSTPAPKPIAPEANTPTATSTAAKGSEVSPQPAKVEDQAAEDLQKALSGESITSEPSPAPASKVETFKWVVEKAAPKFESRLDGTQKVDDRFIIKGAGTKEDPYVVSWEHLVSIQEDFDPAQKKDKIPSRISFLDNTYVKITSYICFPLYVPQPKELLAMLNQWDGCCIGVPPTAYDAIEVHLRSKVEEEMRFAVHGSIVGKLQVKPYVTGNWLVGLYLMTEAEFEPSQGGGT